LQVCEIKHEHSPYRKKKVVPKQNKRKEFQIIGYDNLHYLIQYCTCLPIFVHIRGNFDLIVSVRGEGELGLIPHHGGIKS
jgi:hypothetical protein